MKESDPSSSHALILRWVGAGAGRRLLDVGCAQGDLAQRFTELGFEVTGIERNLEWAAIGQTKCRTVLVADLDREVPAVPGKFDVIVYGDILEHLKNPLDVFRSLNQSLVPGGRLIVSVPNIAHLYVRLQLLVGRFDYQERGILDRTHLRFFTVASLRSFLRAAGVRPVQIVGTAVPLPLVWPQAQGALWLRVLHGWNAVLVKSWKTLFGYQLVADCRLEDAA